MLPLTLLCILLVASSYSAYYLWQGDFGLSPFTTVSVAGPAAFFSHLANSTMLDWLTTGWALLFILANADKVVLAALAAFIVNGRARLSAEQRLRAYINQRNSNLDGSNRAYEVPQIAIQVPLFNETSVARRAIQHACAMVWPAHKLIIQILDDSTKQECRTHVDEEVALHQSRGINVSVLRREDRRGFKAGALNDGMKQLPKDTKYVVIFDADFMPESSFLHETIGYLQADDLLAFVQTKWTYVNSDESLLSLVQLVNLNFHHYIEQTVRSYFGWFANFCGKCF